MAPSDRQSIRLKAAEVESRDGGFEFDRRVPASFILLTLFTSQNQKNHGLSLNFGSRDGKSITSVNVS